jgi:TatA/E family protein of Tat protein translocase
MGHWFQIVGLLVLALLVFGPKRMVEMGSSLGKAFKEFRNSTKDLNLSEMFSGLDSSDEPPARITPITPVTPVTSHIVEGSIEPPADSEITSDTSASDSH